MGVREGIDPTQLAETGWGVIFAQDADPAIRDALRELLTHRRAQACQVNDYGYRDYSGLAGYFAGESKQDFFLRHNVGPGPADPEKMPYYLLLVGDPETIPYQFQRRLDVQYAVGRLAFDTPEEYARYAHAVVLAETGPLAPPRRAVFFGPQNADDQATAISSELLVRPLAAQLACDYPQWETPVVLGAEATKARLSRLLHERAETPALLFTASQGLSFPWRDPRQRHHQGALVCQDWPGPKASHTALPEAFYFSGDDVSTTARLGGLISMHFASFSAGTPKYFEAGKDRVGLARQAFVAHLPQRLLGQVAEGALACIGLADYAWGFAYGKLASLHKVEFALFASCLARLLEGCPVGLAMEAFNAGSAELSSYLTETLERLGLGKPPDEMDLAYKWAANNDARNMLVFGDPAVHITANDPR